MSGAGPRRRKASIDAVDASSAQSFTVTSPRSLAALRNCSLGADQLQYKPLEDFQDADIPPKVVRLNHELFEKRRRERLSLVKVEYLAVCRWAALLSSSPTRFARVAH